VKDTVKAIVKAGIPVMGHLGLTPQTISMLGGFKVQGKDAKAAQKIIDDALMLEDAEAFSVILEAIPHPLPSASPSVWPFPRLELGQAFTVTGRCWSSMICWVSSIDLHPNSSNATSI